MKDMEKRINEAFPKALLHMEEENAFWEAYERYCDANRTYAEVDHEDNVLLAKITFSKLVEAEDDIEAKRARVLERLKEAAQALELATDEYDKAKNRLHAIPKEILEAKKARIRAKYHVAECEYLRLQREESMANLEKLIAVDVEQKVEAARKVAEVEALLSVARDEFYKAKNDVQLLGGFGEV